MSRPYIDPDADAAIIAYEVLTRGQSTGWSGTLEDLGELQRRLRKHNIHFTDDMRGTWEPSELGLLMAELDDDDVESITEFVRWLRS